MGPGAAAPYKTGKRIRPGTAAILSKSPVVGQCASGRFVEGVAQLPGQSAGRPRFLPQEEEVKRLSVVLALLMVCVAVSWGYGYKVTIQTAGPCEIFFVDESALESVSEHDRRALAEAGEAELFYRSDAEYMILLIDIAEPGALVRVEIAYLDGEDKPLESRPVKFVVEGLFGGLRVKHPLWTPKSA